jgi:hypothetical protein
MNITEADDDCGMMSMPKMPEMPCDIEMPSMPDTGAVCDTMKSMEQKAQDTIKSMMKKANTTVEKAKKAIEQDGIDCDFSNIAG